MDFNVAVVERREGICLSHADATHLHFNPIFPKEYVWDIGETSWLQKRPHFPSCFESWDEVLTWCKKEKKTTKNKRIHIRILYRTSIKVCPQDGGPIASRSKLIRRCYIVLWWYFFPFQGSTTKPVLRFLILGLRSPFSKKVKKFHMGIRDCC